MKEKTNPFIFFMSFMVKKPSLETIFSID